MKEETVLEGNPFAVFTRHIKDILSFRFGCFPIYTVKSSKTACK